MAFDRGKFKTLVHYVVWRVGDRAWFGAVKLNKVLWFADTETYAHTGKPITGATYTRHQFGPVPKAIMPIRAELEREGSITVARVGKGDRFIAITKPNMHTFTPAEMAVVDYWVEHIATYETAGSISEKSHDYTWQTARMGEAIPMIATFARRIHEPDAHELRWGKETAHRLGLP